MENIQNDSTAMTGDNEWWQDGDHKKDIQFLNRNQSITFVLVVARLQYNFALVKTLCGSIFKAIVYKS